MNGNVPNRRGQPEEPRKKSTDSGIVVFFKGLLILAGTLAVGVFVFGGLVLATCFLSF